MQYGKNVIKIYVNQETFEHIKYVEDEPGIQIIVKKENESNFRFVQKIRKERFDIIFITTIEFDPLPFAFFNPKKTGARTFVTFHNVDKWFKPYRLSGIKGTINHFLRYFWKKRLSVVCVDSKNVADYIKKEYNFTKPVVSIPFIIYEGLKNSVEKNEGLVVCIPGTLSEERREYLKFLGSFEKNIDKNSKVTLELLGAPSSDKTSKSSAILSRCRNLRKRGFNIIYYEDFLSREEYEYRLSCCDIIFGPIPKKTNDEIYGVTKDTGVNFNMIGGAKPGLLPNHFKNLFELESSTIYFNTYSEAFKIILELSRDEKRINLLKNRAQNNSLAFSPEKVRAHLRKEGLII